MHLLRTVLLRALLACCLMLQLQVSAQLPGEKKISNGSVKETNDISTSSRIFDLNPRLLRVNDTLWLYSGICKILKRTKYEPTGNLFETHVIANKKRPFLQVHGNVQYSYLYNSFVDTPFSQRDFQQHTIQTSLTVTVKDKYPLRVNLSARINNSPFFRNFFDAGLFFDRYAYVKNYKQQLLDRIAAYHFQQPDLQLMETALKQLIERYNSLARRLKDPDILQQIVEEREREYYKKNRDASSSIGEPAINVPDQPLVYKNRLSSLTDSLVEKHSYSDFIESKTKELDSLEQQITTLQSKTDSLKNTISRTMLSVSQKIARATNKQELRRMAAENGVVIQKQKGIDNFLADVKSIGIGRTLVNYSELTAWDISLTGLSMEYNPGIYAAIAVGKIDYGFSNLFGRNSRQKGQQLVMGRIGLGNKERKAIILSVFTGRKYNYGSFLSDSISDRVSLAGYSVEGILKKNENTGISAEIAKSTRPVSGTLRQNHGLKNLFDFSDKSNIGISVKGQTLLTETNTRLSGFYRKTGENYQSFSLFTYNTGQTAWCIKADQSLLQDKIGLIAMIRRNDFTNPFTQKTFKTSTVFTTLQANIRFPKWPALSIGYYPGSQLYVVDKEKINENAYYILNGSLVYSYAAGSTRMISSLVYNSYFSKGTDSEFIAYKGINYLASQTLLFKNMQLQGSCMYTEQEQMKYYTLEGNVDYSITPRLHIGGGGKYNKIINGQSYWGSRVQVGIEFIKLGGFQLQYEKSYLPTIYQSLFPVEIGRVSWFKYF